MLGYVVVTLLLAGGMELSTRRLAEVASVELAHVRAKENEITFSERLRWSGELVVSAGRGYLISGDPSLLEKLRAAQAEFEANLQALEKSALDAEGAALVSKVERAADSFTRVQEELLAARTNSDNASDLVLRFETELLPLRPALSESLDRLVEHQEAAITAFYDETRRDRIRQTNRMRGLLGVLVVISLGIAWYFAKLLGRSYRLEREALETARKALAARDEIMGMVAHDLRNPLGAITMKAALLRQQAESEQTHKQAESIEKVALRMAHLIKSMLDVATLEAGRFSVTPADCGVDEIVSEGLDMVAAAVAKKSIRLRRMVEQSGLVIRADRERVLQVLSNLLENAVKFSPEGGEVVIGVERQAAMVRFTVSDTGPGISEAQLPRLFDRFWKSETSGKPGTGLGLFIAKGIVDAHGGQIGAESPPGQGATFYFTLPLAEPRVAAALPHEAGASSVQT